MQLDKWSTNNEGLQAKLLLDNRQPTSHKILGVEWDKEKDSFVFKGVILQNLKLPLNKRSVLSILGSFFDPLGLISSFILVGECLRRGEGSSSSSGAPENTTKVRSFNRPSVVNK